MTAIVCRYSISVRPAVEFIQGIPLDLEKDTFFNPAVRNIIVLDDLMSTANKDPRISDLFTKGSHHRNLSFYSIRMCTTVKIQHREETINI